MARTTQSSTTKSSTAKSSTTKSSPRPTRSTGTLERASDTRPHEGVTLTIPRPIVDIATAPFAIAGRVLPAKKGLPLYVGLGVLAAAEIIEWPVAAGIGVGYAAIRRWGPQGEQASSRRGGPRTAERPHLRGQA
jgi:hypothetical protein